MQAVVAILLVLMAGVNLQTQLITVDTGRISFSNVPTTATTVSVAVDSASPSMVLSPSDEFGAFSLKAHYEAKPVRQVEVVVDRAELSAERRVVRVVQRHRLGRPPSALEERAADAGEVMNRARALALELGGLSPAVMRLGRRAIFAAADMTLRQQLEYLRSQFTINALAEDAAEGIAAFFEKREPQWKGR